MKLSKFLVLILITFSALSWGAITQQNTQKFSNYYRKLTGIYLNLNEPWRFTKNFYMSLSSNESYVLVNRLFNPTGTGSITQTQFDNLMKNSLAQPQIYNAMNIFLKDAGMTSFLIQQYNNNWQLLFAYEPVKTASNTNNTPQETENPAVAANKTPNFVNTVSQLVGIESKKLLNEPWRFEGNNIIKTENKESYRVLNKIFNNFSQVIFDNFMDNLKQGKLPDANNQIKNYLAKLSLNKFSIEKFGSDWQFWFQADPTKPNQAEPKTDWLNNIVSMAAPYYLKAYEDDPSDIESRAINGQTFKVFRPDHALAHAIRKSALVLDMLELIRNNKQPATAYQVITQLSKDVKNFDQLIEIAMLLLRAGRQSEDLENTHYKEYCYASAAIFDKETKNYSQLFHPDDIADFVVAMKAIGDNQLAQQLKPKQFWIMNLLYATHHLDLLRIPSFGGGKKLDVDITKNAVAGFLSSTKDDPIIAKLFEISGKYLDATGDRNVPKGVLSRGDEFFIQANQPQLIINAIKKAGGFK